MGIKYRGKGGVDTRRDHENNNRRGAESIENRAGGHGLLGFQSDGLTFFGSGKNGNLKYGLLVYYTGSRKLMLSRIIRNISKDHVCSCYKGT